MAAQVAAHAAQVIHQQRAAEAQVEAAIADPADPVAHDGYDDDGITVEPYHPESHSHYDAPVRAAAAPTPSVPVPPHSERPNPGGAGQLIPIHTWCHGDWEGV